LAERVRVSPTSFIEQFYRAGPSVGPLVVGPLRQHEDFDELVAALAPEATVNDLAGIARPLLAAHSDLAAAKALALNPTFALSGALGGADADLISDGVLVELKATTPTNMVTGKVLWQIIGYALADSDDRYRIREPPEALRPLDPIASERYGLTPRGAAHLPWRAAGWPVLEARPPAEPCPSSLAETAARACRARPRWLMMRDMTGAPTFNAESAQEQAFGQASSMRTLASRSTKC
jgi:hypothetical protein